MVDDGPSGTATFVSTATPSGRKKRPEASDASEASELPQAALVSPVVANLGVNSSVPTATGANDSASSQGSGTGQGTTSFFQISTRGQRIVYVVDASSSMGKNGAWTRARHELLESVRRLPATAQFQVIVYNSRPRTLLTRFPDWLSPTSDMVREVEQALVSLIPEGSTDHGPALRQALGLGPDSLYFLTDADDLKQEHLYLANQHNRGRAVIHTIELTTANRARPGMPLQLLARHNGGVYRAVDLTVR